MSSDTHTTEITSNLALKKSYQFRMPKVQIHWQQPKDTTCLVFISDSTHY